jgi:ArsR family transcriptional regulator
MMARYQLSPEILPVISERFRALADPTRLQLLMCLRGGPLTVGELVEETGLQQANVSKHLQVLHDRSFVKRRKEGLFVRYRLADTDVFELCDIMCGRLETETADQRRLVSGRFHRWGSAARPARSP